MTEMSVEKTMSLSGQKNYLQWSKIFKIKAKEKQLWEFCTGEQATIIKPDYDAYVPEILNQRSSQISVKIKSIDGRNNMISPSKNTTSTTKSKSEREISS